MNQLHRSWAEEFEWAGEFKRASFNAPMTNNDRNTLHEMLATVCIEISSIISTVICNKFNTFMTVFVY